MQCWTEDLRRWQERALSSRKEKNICSLAVCSHLSVFSGRMEDCEEFTSKSKEKWIFVNKKREVTKHQTEWCVPPKKKRCMRCGRSNKNIELQGTCADPQFLTVDSKHKLGRWRNSHLVGHVTR